MEINNENYTPLLKQTLSYTQQRHSVKNDSCYKAPKQAIQTESWTDIKFPNHSCYERPCNKLK